MSYNEVMKELENLGSEQTRKIYTNHGADIPMFGVSIANLKKIAKKNKNNNELGKKLFFSNNVDAIYLSQFILDDNILTISDLEQVALSTNYYMILDNVVAVLAAKNRDIAFECLDKWLDHEDNRLKQIAYSLYSLILLSYDESLIDKEKVLEYARFVKDNIHSQENRVRYSMNGFLISVGSSYGEYTPLIKDYAKEVGKVSVLMGKTACKVPDAFSYIEKIESMGNIGKKRKL